jgi:thiamine-monophosphate kinase
VRRDPTIAKRWDLNSGHQDYLKARYLIPQPRSAICEALRAHATAAMDVSDGLVGGLAKLCRASSVSAEIDVDSVPLSDAARAACAKEPALMETILTGGDDYEVVATVPTAAVEAFRRAALAAHVVVTEIGKVVGGEGTARFLDRKREALIFARPSFSHF